MARLTFVLSCLAVFGVLVSVDGELTALCNACVTDGLVLMQLVVNGMIAAAHVSQIPVVDGAATTQRVLAQVS